MNKPQHIITAFLLGLCAIILVGLQIKLFGWILYAIGMLSLLLCAKQFRKDIFLIFISLGLLGVTPITTDISYVHILQMGILLMLAVALPYYISRFVYKNYLVRFTFQHKKNWYKTKLSYIIFTLSFSYFFLPFGFASTGSYQNWTVEPGFEKLFVLFICMLGVGMWDELFFLSTIFKILRRYFTFTIANITQAVLFTSFLYELGFRGWIVFVILIFTLLQGYIFTKTQSLFYVLAVHLTLDLLLYLVLIHAYYPSWMPFLFVM